MSEDLRYGGRTLEVRVYVNTDENALEVAKRVQMAVAGARDDTAVASAVELPADTAKKLWTMLFEQARAQALGKEDG